MIILGIVIGAVIGYFIGRGSIRWTYGGEILTEVTDAGTKRYILELSTDPDTLDQKKRVLFKVVPRQDSLL